MTHEHAPNCLAPAMHAGPCNARWWCPACGHASNIMPNGGVHSHFDMRCNEYEIEVVLIADHPDGEPYEVAG